MKLPDELFGKSTKDAYQKYLEDSAKKPPEPPKPERKIIADISAPESYILLEGKAHGSYSYPDILVSMDKFLPNLNWQQAHEALQKENSLMLAPRQYVDFLNLLKSGNAYDGNGNKIDSSRLSAMLEDITAVRDPWRAEWLDAKFGNDAITYHKINPDGSSKQVTEPLEECLTQDRTPGIDLDDWIKRANNQGLPPENVKEGSLYYWYPRNGCVAGFDAYSGWAYFGCNGDPLSSGAALRVRRAKFFHRK